MSDVCWFHVEENAHRRSNTKSFGSTVVMAEPGSATGTTDACWFFRRASGHDDKFVLRCCAPRQGALANNVQALALAHTPHLADRDGCVFPGLSDTSIRKLAESFSEISNRIGKDRIK